MRRREKEDLRRANLHIATSPGVFHSKIAATGPSSPSVARACPAPRTPSPAHACPAPRPPSPARACPAVAASPAPDCRPHRLRVVCVAAPATCDQPGRRPPAHARPPGVHMRRRAAGTAASIPARPRPPEDAIVSEEEEGPMAEQIVAVDLSGESQSGGPARRWRRGIAAARGEREGGGRWGFWTLFHRRP